MAAPRGASESSNTVLYVLVTFIVLFLVMSVFAIMQYMNNEDLKQETQQAQEKLKKIGTDAEIRSIDSIAKSRGGSNVTVLGQLTADMLDMCNMIGGESLTFENLSNARIKANERFNELTGELGARRALPDSPVITIKAGLANVIESLLQENDSWYSYFQQSQENMQQLKTMKEQEVAQKNEEIAQKNQELSALSQKAATYTQQINDTTAEQLRAHQSTQQMKEDEKTKLEARKTELETELESLRKELTDHRAKITELLGILQKERPSPEMEMLAREADGYIVSVTGDNLVYINLTRDDHIYPGLTFSVYDSMKSISKEGEGKATVEVIEVGDTVSKCRVTNSDTKNQIIKNDHIANLIWNKDKNFIFTVIGEYDFDRDGTIDPDGRKRIEGLIKAWDGIVTNYLSVKTDFVVMGEKPQLPTRPMDGFFQPGSDSDKAADFSSIEKAILAYDDIQAEAAVMGVPIFTTGRFMKFIGYHEKATKVYGEDLDKLRQKLTDQKRQK